LLIRLRSIGDTVLMTPCVTALKAWRPELQISVLSEATAAPLLEDHPQVDEVIVLEREGRWLSDGVSRWRVAQRLRERAFDAAFNLHGGTTATMLAALSRAPERIGYRGYRYSWLHTRRAPDPQQIWQKAAIHSAEQQLGLLKWCGVPIASPPPSSLRANEQAVASVHRRLRQMGLRGPFAVIHPAATHETKRWSASRFARVVQYLAAKHELPSIVIAAPHEGHITDAVKGFAGIAAHPVTDLTLKEVIALLRQAALFVGNDSGPAHIAAAVGCPTVVIFGASDPTVWRPWGAAPSAVVHTTRDHLGVPLPPHARIRHVRVEQVTEAIERVLASIAEEPSVRASVTKGDRSP
jgi:lipopolysaccharide heptosyltransferase II